MNYFIFLIASSIEYFGTFIFMFALFRFRIRKQLVMSVLLVSFLMSQVSYFTRINPEIETFSTYIQFILFILVVWILFLIPFFHSIIMNFAGVASVIVVQGICIIVITLLTGTSVIEMNEDVWVAAAMQVLTSVIQIAIARLIIIKNWGFDFVPTSPRANVKIRGTNAVLIGIISFAIVLTFLLAFAFQNNFNGYILSACIVFILTVPLFIYFSVRKDKEDAK